MRFTSLVLLAIVSLSVSSAKTVKVAKVAPVIDIPAVVDSALVLADNYADALADKPEMASSRLNMLRNFAAKKPEAVNDSICSRLYEFFVSYTEQNKTDRASAFKDCFLALARPDSPELGPLYATELSIALETVDTVAISKYIPLLAEYAERMNYDYDAEIQDARAFLNEVRTRKPIQEAILGAWVSEDVVGIIMPDGLYYYNYPEKKKDLVNTTKVLQIRNNKHPVYQPDMKRSSEHSLPNENDSISVSLDIIKCRENLSALCPLGSTSWYVPLYAWELPALNMTQKSEEYVDRTSPREGGKFVSVKDHYNEYVSRDVVVDNKDYSIYTFWGDERLKRNDAEIGAMFRQSIQTIQANLAGELSRSNYSFSERMLGNTVAGVVSSGLNALIDSWMVSTEKIWSVEMTLHMENPNKLSAIITAQLIISKSNSEKPEVYVSQHVTNYYRWEPEDDIFFLGCDYRDYQPWKRSYGPILLHRVTKEEKEAYDERYKEFSKAWEDRYKEVLAEKKSRLKTLPKGSDERKALQSEIESFEQRPPQVWVDWNRKMLDKLKAKSDKYEKKQQ